MSSDRRSISAVASGAIVFTDRPPRIRPTLIVVFGSAPTAGKIGSSAAIAPASNWIAFGRPYAPQEWPPSVRTVSS